MGNPTVLPVLAPDNLPMLADHNSANARVNPNGSRLFTSLALVVPDAPWNIGRQ